MVEKLVVRFIFCDKFFVTIIVFALLCILYIKKTSNFLLVYFLVSP